MAYAKGGDVRKASYAKGGPALGRTVDFMKIKDEFRDPDEGDASADEDQKYGKKGEGKGNGCVPAPKARDKSLKPVKPRG